jgi:hypothetical protein
VFPDHSLPALVACGAGGRESGRDADAVLQWPAIGPMEMGPTAAKRVAAILRALGISATKPPTLPRHDTTIL